MIHLLALFSFFPFFLDPDFCKKSTVFDFHLGCHKSEGKAPYVYPTERQTPNNNTTTKRRDRPVQLLSQPLQSLIIPKASATGQTLLFLQTEYQDIFLRNCDELATSQF
jgi:hypothetical protein